MLNAFTSPGRFLRGNLHCHSSRSDGDPMADAFGLIEAMAAFVVLLLATSAIVAARRYGRAVTGLGAYSGRPDQAALPNVSG